MDSQSAPDSEDLAAETFDTFSSHGIGNDPPVEVTPINVKTTLRSAAAQVRQLLNLWDTQTADMIVIGLKAWCALVLFANPEYLYSTLRLRDLAALFPVEWWFAIFSGLGIYMTVGLVFGSAVRPGNIPNPLMQTERQQKLWQYMRMAGWFFGTCFNTLIVILLSKETIWNFGVGFFGLKAVCCTIAFSMPFRMRIGQVQAEVDARRRLQRVKAHSQYQASQKNNQRFTVPPLH